MMHLSAHTERIASIIGRDLALLLLNHASVKTSGHMYVPVRPRPGHCIVSLIGLDAATKLTDTLGGQTVRLFECQSNYLAKRNAEIKRMIAQGATIRTIAKTFQLSDRQIRNLKS